MKAYISFDIGGKEYPALVRGNSVAAVVNGVTVYLSATNVFIRYI